VFERYCFRKEDNNQHLAAAYTLTVSDTEVFHKLFPLSHLENIHPASPGDVSLRPTHFSPSKTWWAFTVLHTTIKQSSIQQHSLQLSNNIVHKIKLILACSVCRINCRKEWHKKALFE